jgi:hypothetical protein
MKEKDGHVDYPDQQVILYVEKENGEFGPIQTGSYLSANYMEDYQLKRTNLEKSLSHQLNKRTISIIQYYMILEELTLSELSARAGIRKSKVKKHLIPDTFVKATVDELLRYARVFNVLPSELLRSFENQAESTQR